MGSQNIQGNLIKNISGELVWALILQLDWWNVEEHKRVHKFGSDEPSRLRSSGESITLCNHLYKYKTG